MNWRKDGLSAKRRRLAWRVAVVLWSSCAATPVFPNDVGGLGIRALFDPDPSGGSLFGAAMAVGRFDHLGTDDLVVCAPAWSSLGDSQEGRCVIALGDFPGGLQWQGAQSFSRSVAGERLGTAIAVGDWNDDGIDELVLGLPGYDANGQLPGTGGVVYLRWNESAGQMVENPGVFVVPSAVRAAGDAAGTALTACDFNGDGWDDFAIGVPGHDAVIELGDVTITRPDAGAVMVAYSNETGFPQGIPLDDFFDRDDFAVFSSQQDERFGSVLTAGHYDGDGYCDLAVGSPLRDVDGLDDVGEVLIVHGGADGLSVASSIQTLRPDDLGLALLPDQEFGAALATADFLPANCLGSPPCTDDLAIGVPGAVDTLPAFGRGAVVLVRSLGSGLQPTLSRVIFQSELPGQIAEDGDRFGEVVFGAALEPPADAQSVIGPDYPEADLLIGAPFEVTASLLGHGAAHLIPNVLSGTDVEPAQGRTLRWSDSALEPDFGQLLGAAFAAGDFDDNEHRDLVVGAPGWGDPTLGAPPDSGVVLLFSSGPLFADDWESGDSSAWDASSP